MQAYSDPTRESDPHALPAVEVFYLRQPAILDECWFDESGEPYPDGWYWRSYFLGCLPTSEPMGPFNSEAKALTDAQDN